MHELKKIQPQSISRALSKAERYRLLNEPRESLSICRDILAIDPENQDAIITLLLTLTDLFPSCDLCHRNEAEALLPRIAEDHRRAYYEGVVLERWAKAKLNRDAPGHEVHDGLTAAMERYERAGALSPEGDDDALLRWNTCARLLNERPNLQPRPAEAGEFIVDEDMPVR